MSDSILEIVFRGDIAPGHNMQEVRDSLRELFKADDAQMARLFSGRPVVVRGNLDRPAADRYQQILLRAGAIAEIRQAREADGAAVEQQDTDGKAGAAETGWGLAPVGADLLNDPGTSEEDAAEVDTSGISLAPVGSDVLENSERDEPQERQVDTSHLSLESTKPQ